MRAQEISTDEVTGQVVDLGARIANLRATESALQAIMARAAKIDDVLAVQKQLTDTRGQIEELVAQQTSLDDQAAFGSLSVTFVLPARPAPAATRPPGWDPARDVDAASAKLVRLGQKTTTAGIWLAIIGLPILVALGVAVTIGWLAVSGLPDGHAAARSRTRPQPDGLDQAGGASVATARIRSMSRCSATSALISAIFSWSAGWVLTSRSWTSEATT